MNCQTLHVKIFGAHPLPNLSSADSQKLSAVQLKLRWFLSLSAVLFILFVLEHNYRRNPQGDGRKGTGQKMSYIVANCRDIL